MGWLYSDTWTPTTIKASIRGLYETNRKTHRSRARIVDEASTAYGRHWWTLVEDNGDRFIGLYRSHPQRRGVTPWA